GVQYWHKIITYRISSAGSQIAQACFVVFNKEFIVAASSFYIFMHWNTFCHSPVHTRCLNFNLPFAYFLFLPPFSSGNMVKCGDDSYRSRLTGIPQAYSIGWPEPAPSMFHIDIIVC